MKTVVEFLKKCGVYYLATTEGNKPKVRPFGTAMLYENHIYIQTGRKKDVAKQLFKNPNAEICACMDGKWLRISGLLKADERVEVKKAMLDEYPELRGMYNENDDNTVVFYFERGIVTFYSFTDAPRTIVF